MRPARALIDCSALRHNYRLARNRHGGRALAVVKANAYGHGAVPCARALADEADGFAVAFVDEALELRSAGILQPILVLEGVFEPAEVDDAMRHDLWLVVHHDAQIRMLETCSATRRLQVWLKLNSGMNRAGFSAAALDAAWQRLRASGAVGDIVLISHLACADEPSSDATMRQIEYFDAATAHLPGARSLANSAGVLAWPAAHRDWARPGILLYGADPMPAGDSDLRAVMTLESTIIAVRELEAGAALGYGGRFVAAHRMRIGLVAMGYADGYPRAVADGTPVVVDGRASRIIGRVSMDMLTVDLSELPGAGIGSKVELWGPQLSVNVVAHAAGTISYELLCGVQRVRFEYLTDGETPAAGGGAHQAKAGC